MHQSEDTRYLLIEAGVRIHITKYIRDKPSVPSAFTIKLRRHLRTKRITSVTQMGVDRAIDITFGSPPADYHLIIEFYSKGLSFPSFSFGFFLFFFLLVFYFFYFFYFLHFFFIFSLFYLFFVEFFLLFFSKV